MKTDQELDKLQAELLAADARRKRKYGRPAPAPARRPTAKQGDGGARRYIRNVKALQRLLAEDEQGVNPLSKRARKTVQNSLERNLQQGERALGIRKSTTMTMEVR